MHQETFVPHPLSDELKKARGKRFVKLFKLIYAEVSPVLADEAKLIISSTGKITLIDIGVLAIQFNLQLKHAFDFLEGQSVLSSGTYSRLKDRGLKASLVMQEAAKRLQVFNQSEEVSTCHCTD